MIMIGNKMRLFSTREGYNLSNEIAHIRNQCNDCFYVPVNFANSETLQAKLSLLIAVSLSAKKEKKYEYWGELRAS